ncbi:MAG: hypothetical protein HYX20_00405 [Candidatus Yanofskybacteria bacterium]|nr:hypothetical protein [Candidatus Yanofskybacteria bacterium]
MKRINIYDFAAIVIFLCFVVGSILIVGKNEQKENTKPYFPTWKTIESGTYKNTNVIRKALISNGFTVEYWADDILDKTPAVRKKIEWNLVLLSAAQLGFNDWVPYENIVRRAQKLGLKLAPAQTGPLLRLQYRDQPENEWLHIAMKPLIDSNGDPTIFDILHYDQHTHNGSHTHGHSLQLCSSSVRHDVLWSPSSIWVFFK